MSKTTIREFNESGLRDFKTFLTLCRDNPTYAEYNETLKVKINELLTNKHLTRETKYSINEDLKFRNRFEFGEYLFTVFGDKPMEKHAGVLSWIALLFIDKICEINPKNNRLKVLSNYRYIPETNNSRRYYRHLILTPLLAYQRLKENSIMVLSNPLHESSDAVEAVLSRQDFWANENLMNLSKKLYFDEKIGRPKANAFSSRENPGNATRLARDLVPQLSMTYDLYDCSPETIFDLLPSEFDHWIDSNN